MNPARSPDSPISPIEEIIEEARNGRMYVLADAQDRENEGDLVIPAQFATPAQVNFMAKHGRGLICLALTSERARRLRLQMMTNRNETAHQTAFTVSIEAREGVSTGISAHDRAHTISVAIDETKGPQDIVSPGHVFPLVAKDGGVLVRAGHTEAAVDISRMAGLYPAGVICEIMNDDGSMARMPDLMDFAAVHGLKIGTIADLIAYRRKHDRLVERRVETRIDTVYGAGFRLVVYRNVLDGSEHVALVRGRIDAERATLVRMHKVEFATDVLGERGPRAGLAGAAMRAIAENSAGGVIVFVRETDPNALSRHFAGETQDDERQVKALREYGIGAQILRDLGVRRMILLTNTAQKIVGLDGYGLMVEDRRPIDVEEER
jgi:3,4-dihydroxy 2-butanone 4-phosphate synthase/GTP cyclohydrolase II